MWFDELMDDSKAALHIVRENKRLFVPIFVQLAFNILLSIAAAIPLFIMVVQGLDLEMLEYRPLEEIIMMFAPIIGIVFLSLAGLFIGSCLIEAGTVNLYKAAVEGVKPDRRIFFQGIKKYFFKVVGGTLFLGIVFLALSPILLLLFVLYAVFVGILTAQWGILFLMATVILFFSAWVNIMAAGDMGPLKAIRTGFRLGRRNFKGLFLIALANILISNYLISLGGAVVALFLGWLITGAVYTYYRMIVYLMYMRKKEELM